MKILLFTIGGILFYGSLIRAQTAADYREQALACIQSQQIPRALYFFKKEWALRRQEPPSVAALRVQYNLAEVYRGIARYDSALVWAAQSLEAHRDFYGALHPETLDAHLLLAQNQYAARSYPQLQKSLHVLLQKEKEAPVFNADWQCKLQILAAAADADLGDYDAALLRYQQALNTSQKPDLQARIYNSMAALKTNQHRWLEALSIYEKALHLRLVTLGEEHPNTASIYENQSVAYLGSGQPQQALQSSHKALRIYRQLYGERHPKVAESYLNLSNAWRKSERRDSAVWYCEKALALYQQTHPKGSPETGYAWLCKARLQGDLGSNFLAINAYQEALKQPLNESDKALAHSEWAALALRQADWQTALLHCRLALALRPSDYLLPDAESCRETNVDKKLFLQLWYQSAQCRRALGQLDLAYQETRLALTLGHQWRHQIGLQSDQADLLHLLAQIAEMGLDLCHRLYLQNHDEYYLSEAFYCMESNKSLHLWGFWKNHKTDAERDLWYAEQEWQRAAPALRPALLQRLFGLRQRCDSLAAYTATSALLQSAPSLNHTQQNLENQSFLLEYFWGEQALYRLCLDKNRVLLDKLPLPDAALLWNFSQHLSGQKWDKNQPESEARQFGEKAYALFQLLMPPVPPHTKRLHIIPDGKLQNLAWEALCSHAPAPNAHFANLPYLLRQWSVNYAYTSAVLIHQNQQKPQNNRQLLAMATGQKDRPLRGSQSEVHWLQTQFSGAYYKEKTATESAFKQTAAPYAVLHLAMHGYVPEAEPADAQLLFSAANDLQNDGILHTEEAAILPLKADLVVLSACQTGLGRQETGEGAMSLARGFVYAGVPSLVLSLWQIHDQSSGLIVQSFYHYLSQGWDKDQALRQAKLDFLEQASSTTAHPQFWAGLVQSGNYRAIHISSQTSHKNAYLSGIFLSFSLVAILVRRKWRIKINKIQ